MTTEEIGRLSAILATYPVHEKTSLPIIDMTTADSQECLLLLATYVLNSITTSPADILKHFLRLTDDMAVYSSVYATATKDPYCRDAESNWRTALREKTYSMENLPIFSISMWDTVDEKSQPIFTSVADSVTVLFKGMKTPTGWDTGEPTGLAKVNDGYQLTSPVIIGHLAKDTEIIPIIHKRRKLHYLSRQLFRGVVVMTRQYYGAVSATNAQIFS